MGDLTSKTIAITLGIMLISSVLAICSQQGRGGVESAHPLVSPNESDDYYEPSQCLSGSDKIDASNSSDLYFQVQSPFPNYRNLNSDSFELSVQTSISAPLSTIGDYKLDESVNGWVSEIYPNPMDLSGVWTFKIYGNVSDPNTHGSLYARVSRLSDNVTLFTTGYDDEDVSAFTAPYHQFAWEYNVSNGVTLPAGDRYYIELFVHVILAASRLPVDVVFALDNSGSMAGTKLADLKTATKNFIGMLNDNDRAAIYDFQGTTNANPMRLRSWAYMTAANRTSFNTSIDGIPANSNTPFYDTLGEAITYSLTYDPTASNPSRLEYVVAFTDGQSNCDDYWTPEANWGSNYTGTDPNGYANLGDVTTGNGFSGGVGHGLVNPPSMVYTIGLSIIHDSTYPTAPLWSRTSPRSATYNVEYDLWHCADSSPAPEGKYGYNSTSGQPFVGHYYYTAASSELWNIFNDVISVCIGEMTGCSDSFTFAYDSAATPSSVIQYIEPAEHLLIPIVAGWNLISIPLVPQSSALQSALADCDGDTQWDRAMRYDSSDSIDHWKQYNDNWPATLNDFNNVDNKIGIWINITAIGDGYLNLSGTLPSSTQIYLRAGWNLVGYPTLFVNMSVANVFWGTGADIVEVFDSGATYLTTVVGPSYVMKPGEGYWVHVPADSVWTVDW